MFLLRGCGGSSDPIIGTTVETIHHTDTIKVHTVDTLMVEGPTKYIYKDSPVDGGIDDEGNTFWVHRYDEEDLIAEVTTTDQGGQYIDYNVVCPVITKTDSIIITNTDSIIVTNNVEKRTNNLFIGSEIAISDKEISGVGLNLTWQMKNDLQIYYEYGAMFNTKDQHRFGVKIPLRRNNN